MIPKVSLVVCGGTFLNLNVVRAAESSRNGPRVRTCGLGFRTFLNFREGGDAPCPRP